MTQQRSGSPEQDGAGDDERAARLRALLSVPIDIPGRAAVVEPEDAAPTTRPGERPAEPGGADVEAPADATDTGTAPDEPEAHDAEADDTDHAPGASPDGAGRRPVPLASVVSAVVLVALFAAGIGLAYAGTRIIRSSTEGEVLEPVDDPTAPGFEALVEPTPTLAVLHDLDGEIDAITVLTLPSPDSGGGGVVFVPTRVIADMPIFGVAPIEAGYDLGTAQVQAEVVGDVLGAGIGEVAVVDAERWAGLVAPVAPLVVDNPDDLYVDDELRFPAGEIELEADDVGPYLEARVEGQSELARLFRHETLWRAWLTAVQDAGRAEAVPGELESGVGHFVRELARGTTVLERLPVEEGSSEEFADEPTFVTDPEAVEALVAELIPFPRSPRPGVRERVRVLNGTDDLEAARRAAPELPPVGVEVVIVGNASRFDHETTTIAYVGPEHEEAARAIRDVLGAGEVLQDPRPSDVVDITVTLGADHD